MYKDHSDIAEVMKGPGMNELLDLFLEKIVLINIDRFRVKGKLMAYAGNSKNGHIPGMLVLTTKKGITLVRGAWTSIGEEKKSRSKEENS